MEIAIGAAGVAAGVLCALFYAKGFRDAMKMKRAATPDETEQAENGLLKKYEAILSYDPYGDRS